MEFTEVNIIERSGMYYKGTCLVDGMFANFHVSFLRKEDSLHLWARVDGFDSSERWNSDEPVNWVYELAVVIKIIQSPDSEITLSDLGIVKKVA